MTVSEKFLHLCRRSHYRYQSASASGFLVAMAWTSHISTNSWYRLSASRTRWSNFSDLARPADDGTRVNQTLPRSMPLKHICRSSPEVSRDAVSRAVSPCLAVNPQFLFRSAAIILVKGFARSMEGFSTAYVVLLSL